MQTISHLKPEFASPNLSLAMVYAGYGWRVHPLHHIREDGTCSCGKQKCKTGKHPRLTSKWQIKATTNLDTIRSWWTKHPLANIGIVLDNLIVIDVDPRNGGSLQESIDTYPVLQEVFDNAYCVKTGGGGTHHYFNGGFRVEYKKHLLGKGIEVLTGNQYVIAPPSNHVSGGTYETVRNEITDMPPVLQALVKPVGGAKVVPVSICEGERNITLASIAGKLFKQGWSITRVKAKLQETNALRCTPALEYEEVESIADSIVSKAKNDNLSKKTQWQMAVTRDMRLTDKQVRILISLSHYMDEHGQSCFPSQATLAEDAGCCEKTVRNHLKKLIEAGYLYRYLAGKGLKRHQGHQHGYVATLPDDEC